MHNSYVEVEETDYKNGFYPSYSSKKHRKI